MLYMLCAIFGAIEQGLQHGNVLLI